MLRRSLGWVVLGSLVCLVGAVRADHRSHCECVVRLAGDVKRHADDLGREIRHSPLRATPHFVTLYGLSQQLGSQADCLAGMARHGASYHALQRDLEKVSCTFRELTHAYRRANDCGPARGVHTDFRHVSKQPGHGHGSSHSASSWARFNDVDRLLDCTAKKIDELSVAVANTRDHRAPPVSPPGHPGAGRPGSGRPGDGRPGDGRYESPSRSGVGLSFNNGRVTFSFGR